MTCLENPWWGKFERTEGIREAKMPKTGARKAQVGILSRGESKEEGGCAVCSIAFREV